MDSLKAEGGGVQLESGTRGAGDGRRKISGLDRNTWNEVGIGFPVGSAVSDSEIRIDGGRGYKSCKHGKGRISVSLRHTLLPRRSPSIPFRLQCSSCLVAFLRIRLRPTTLALLSLTPILGS
jgi:hypothetical protein